MATNVKIVKVDVEGVTALALDAALYQEASNVIAHSQQDLVPVDTGTLKASGTVLPPERVGSRTTVTLGYGGAAKDYAEIQERREDFHHKVGQAHYLEQAVMDAVPGLGERLAARLRADIERGTPG